MMEPSSVGVCALPPPPRNSARTVAYPEYVHEILGHAGLCYAPLNCDELADALPRLRVLVTVGETAFNEDLREQLSDWVAGGGAWLSVGGTCGVPELFGVRMEPPAYSSWGGGLGTLGEGYLSAKDARHPITSHVRTPLHYFNGAAVIADGAAVLADVLDAHQRPTRRAAATEVRRGEGACLLIAPDLTGTVVRVQQGVGVTRDGVSAPDGTAPIGDSVLKSGDGGVLDWLFDREPVEGARGLSAFLEPVADLWAEMLVRAILYVARERGVALPVLWLYPRDLPALAHLSHDSDGNDAARAMRMLEVVGEAEVNSTWCVMAPGYPGEVIDAIRAAGHELAMHYDAVAGDFAWGEQQFDSQWREISGLFGEPPATNKNHFLRWEGDTEFFEWLVRRGIRLDQSKGASKSGEAGFNFGTCHIYRPVAPDGRILDVLEMPTVTQDLEVFAPAALLGPVLQAVRARHGILHLLFHPAHIETAGVADTLRAAIDRARALGMEWWTAARIAGWERARRRAEWSHSARSGAVLRVVDPLPEACVMLLTDSDSPVTVNGTEAACGDVERWGFRFRSVRINGAPGDYEVEMGGA